MSTISYGNSFKQLNEQEYKHHLIVKGLSTEEIGDCLTRLHRAGRLRPYNPQTKLNDY